MNKQLAYKWLMHKSDLWGAPTTTTDYSLNSLVCHSRHASHYLFPSLDRPTHYFLRTKCFTFYLYSGISPAWNDRSSFLMFVLWIASGRQFKPCLLACHGWPRKKRYDSVTLINSKEGIISSFKTNYSIYSPKGQTYK